MNDTIIEITGLIANNQISKIIHLLLLELSFWSVVIGCAAVAVSIIEKLNRKELAALFGIIIIGFILRIKYSAFVPIHEFDDYVFYITNFYNNYLLNNFFYAPNIVEASSGFFELFINKFLFFAPSFNVYYIFYVNLIISLFKIVCVFYLASILFKNKVIAYGAALILAFCPIEIKLAATEIYFHPVSLVFLLFLIFLYTALKKFEKKYIVLFCGIYIAGILGRIDFTVFIMILALGIFIYLIIFNREFRYQALSNKILQIVFFIIIISTTIEASRILSSGIIESYGFHKYIYFVKMFIPDNYFNPYSKAAPVFLRYYFVPIYFFAFFLLSWLAVLFKFKERKNYIFLLILIAALLYGLFLVYEHRIKDMRRVLLVLPLVSIAVSYTMYIIFHKLRIKDKYIVIIGLLIIFSSFFQNLPFLNLVFGRKAEQDFIIENLKKIPEGSLLLTIAEKKFIDSKFTQYRYYNTPVHGLEFPYYLLVGRNIDIMDIYREYDKEIINSYSGVYYFRGMYSYHEEIAPFATKEFEESHSLTEIASQNIINHDFDCQTVNELRNGNKNTTIETDEKILGLGFYKVNNQIREPIYLDDNFSRE